MIEALIGFFIGVAGTYLAITQHQESEDEFRALLRELDRERPEAAGG